VYWESRPRCLYIEWSCSLLLLPLVVAPSKHQRYLATRITHCLNNPFDTLYVHSIFWQILRSTHIPNLVGHQTHAFVPRHFAGSELKTWRTIPGSPDLGRLSSERQQTIIDRKVRQPSALLNTKAEMWWKTLKHTFTPPPVQTH
jgi:hypothetical protein